METVVDERLEHVEEAANNMRGEPRKAVLKRAEVVFDTVVINCIVENMSNGGARLRFGAPVLVPDVFSLRFHDGATYPCRRCWGRGAVLGVEFTGPGPAAESQRRHLTIAVQDAVATADPTEALRLLRQVWFFGDEGLHRAAEALEVARARFLSALDPHVERRSSNPAQPTGSAAS